MRLLRFIFAFAVLNTSLLAQVSEIDSLREPYRKSLAAVQAAKQERGAPATRAYLDALTRLEPQFANNPAAELLREERARVTEGRPLLEAECSSKIPLTDDEERCHHRSCRKDPKGEGVHVPSEAEVHDHEGRDQQVDHRGRKQILPAELH